MFLPSGTSDFSSWLEVSQIVADPENYRKKLNELTEINNTSKANFEENKKALMDLERKTKEFEEEKTKFYAMVEDKTKRIQNTLDDLFVRNKVLTEREQDFNRKDKSLNDSVNRRLSEAVSKENAIAAKETIINTKLEEVGALKQELETKVSRLRAVKDLLDNA